MTELTLEDKIAQIATQENIDANRKLGEQKLKGLDHSQILQLRHRAKHDLFFLIYGILGYKDLSVNLHGHLCNWLEETKLDRFRLVLLPRSHFKSTTLTIGDSIQIALPDDSKTLEYPFNLGPNVRILLGHESAFGAQRFLYEITNHFCNNPVLMALFPECVPSPRVQRINTNELELPREDRWAEPTFDTMGVGGRSQGRHYNIIKLDDIFGDKARDSAADRNTTIQWIDNIQAFFVNLPKDHLDLVGTRYSLDDVYEHVMSVYGKSLTKYIRRIEEVVDDVLQPIFPERFTTESLSILRKNPTVWAAQYVNDPVAGLAEFDRNWKRFYNWLGKDKISVFTGKGHETIKLSDLDIVMICDPAVTGLGGYVITGTDSKMRVFVLEAIKRAIPSNEFPNFLFTLVQRYWPRTVAIENVLFSALYKPWLEAEMKLRGIRFHITPYKIDYIKHIGKSTPEAKRDRVKGLAPYFSAGQIFYNHSQSDLITEHDSFGATENYHILDALAEGPKLWRPKVGQAQWDRRAELELQTLDNRDVVTGY